MDAIELPPKVQSALDKYVTGYAYPRVQNVITEALADAWDEGYRYWYDHDDVAPGDGDYGKGNPYRAEAPR